MSDQPGFVYVISGEKKGKTLYKIGRTNNLHQRLNYFGVMIPFPISFVCSIEVIHSARLERSLHCLYADKRVEGEWFDLSSSDIDSLRNDYKDWPG